MGNAMGVNTWAAFVGTDDKAAVMGDFAMYENRNCRACSRPCAAAGINIVAIHNHMAGESRASSSCTSGASGRRLIWPGVSRQHWIRRTGNSQTRRAVHVSPYNHSVTHKRCDRRSPRLQRFRQS